ncbi:MAG: RluA family pseudouridine synthase [Desulfobacterales bacterium]|nr:RluA family pseudouridine synthase [Desulfobacterales bacterium]
METGRAISFVVEAPEMGDRLDSVTASRVSGLSRSLAASLIKKGAVRVEGDARKPGYRVRTGDRIYAVIPEPEPAAAAPEPMDLNILHEDRCIIVIDKPPGMVVHPGPGHRRGVLVNGLMHHCPQIAMVGDETRPGVVHRLDKDTSGVLIAAKTNAAHRHLTRQFKARTIRKNYIALIYGETLSTTGVITLPIGRDPFNRKRMSVNSPTGRASETRWEVIERLNGAALIDVDLRTGRTHQIRVHCAAMGRPVVGDAVYGRRRKMRGASPADADPLARAPRQMLHARRIQFQHPGDGETVVFEAAMPRDMKDLLGELRK